MKKLTDTTKTTTSIEDMQKIILEKFGAEVKRAKLVKYARSCMVLKDRKLCVRDVEGALERIKPTVMPMVYRTTVRKRGWTEHAIDKYLGEPDKFAVNPHYSSGPKSKLYLLYRVEELEKRVNFREQRPGHNLVVSPA